MATLEIQHSVDKFVIYFQTPRPEINAYALASALVGLADAVRDANAAINPGYRVEVVVEALSEGSFKATVRTVFEKAKNLFSHEAAKAIIYGIIATHIYEKAIKSDEPPKVIVSESMVVIDFGKDKIIVPRDVYEATKLVEKSEKFKSSISKMVGGASSDASVEGLGFSASDTQDKPTIYVPRENFFLLQSSVVEEDHLREVYEQATLEISRAILERGERKWEFFWRGIKISAPVLDTDFYDKFFAHQITIAPGDALEVLLKIIQERNADTGIFVNIRYEVVDVHRHIPRVKQPPLK